MTSRWKLDTRALAQMAHWWRHFEVKVTGRRGMGADRVVSVLYRPDARRPRDFDLPTVSLALRGDHLDPGPLAASWRNTIWPLGREALFAKLAARGSACRDSQGTYWMGDAEPAFDSDVHAGPMFCLFLAVALGARHPKLLALGAGRMLASIDDVVWTVEAWARPCSWSSARTL